MEVLSFRVLLICMICDVRVVSLEYVRGVLQKQYDEALREVDATSRALDALDQAIEGEK